VEDTDASDLVEKERKEAKQAKRQAEQAKRQAEQAKRQAAQEGYYGWFLDIFNNEILPGIKNNNKDMVIKGLSKINKNIKMQNIDKDKKEEIVN
jgi:multidrug efflux pump subunit AcrA (membrane-fusion protein)